MYWICHQRLLSNSRTKHLTSIIEPWIMAHNWKTHVLLINTLLERDPDFRTTNFRPLLIHIQDTFNVAFNHTPFAVLFHSFSDIEHCPPQTHIHCLSIHNSMHICLSNKLKLPRTRKHRPKRWWPLAWKIMARLRRLPQDIRNYGTANHTDDITWASKLRSHSNISLHRNERTEVV